jgi:hypothetical protein
MMNCWPIHCRCITPATYALITLADEDATTTNAEDDAILDAARRLYCDEVLSDDDDDQVNA